jgi:hypothetical protein
MNMEQRWEDDSWEKTEELGVKPAPVPLFPTRISFKGAGIETGSAGEKNPRSGSLRYNSMIFRTSRKF